LHFQVVKGGNLEQILVELQQQSEASYLNSLTYQVKVLLQSSTGSQLGMRPQNDLAPTQSVGKLLNLLKEILSVANMVEGRQSDITKIVSTVVDPLLKSVTQSASHLPSTDMAVYLLNNLYQMQSTLAMYEYMDLERLQGQSEAQIDQLTSEQASSLVANLNLGPIYTVLQQNAQFNVDIDHLKLFMVSGFWKKT
jgi:conserved oligomeric Golgi complex subunit 6